MAEKTIMVTGSTDGIGLETARQLALMGHHVIVHGRNPDKTGSTIGQLEKDTGSNTIAGVSGDLSSLEQVRSMAAEVQRKHPSIDVLINNAGIYAHDRHITGDGMESTFQVNYLSAFLLTLLLLDKIITGGGGRIINVSSMIHASSIDFDNLNGERSFSGGQAYSLSKLCMILFTFKLSDLLSDTPVTVNCLHPGVIHTKLLRAAFGGGAPVPEGAETPVYLATADDVAHTSGKYFVNKTPQKPAPAAMDNHIQNRLWNVSQQLAGISRDDIKK